MGKRQEKRGRSAAVMGKNVTLVRGRVSCGTVPQLKAKLGSNS